MPVTLTCECGARFEIDDTLAGAATTCPECRQAVPVITTGPPRPRIAVLALFSLVLAMTGVLSSVGAVAAVVVGTLALLQIARPQPRLTGRQYAAAGIVLGSVCAVLTPLVVRSGATTPLATWLGTRLLAARTDPAASWPMTTVDGGCRLARPSAEWVRLRGGRGCDPAVDDLQTNRDVVLAHRRRRAYLDLARDAANHPPTLAEYQTVLLAALPTRSPLLAAEDDTFAALANLEPWQVGSQRGLPLVGGYAGYEWSVEFARGGRTWRMLARIWRKKGDKNATLYVARAYAPARLFPTIEAEVLTALDHVQLTP